MFRKTIAFIGVASVLSGAYGCSSSSSGGSNTVDSGTPATDAGGSKDASTPHQDAGGTVDSGGSGNDAGGVTKDAGSGNDASSPNDAGMCPNNSGTVYDGSAPACYAALVVGFASADSFPVPTTYQGLCAPSDIVNFLANCGDFGNASGCYDWQTANVAANGSGIGDGGTGSACGNCIFPFDNSGNPLNSGPTYVVTDQTGDIRFGPNYGTCIATVSGTDGGETCGTSFSNALTCAEDFACSECDGTDLASCQGFATGTSGICGSYQTTAASDCADYGACGGPIQMCTPNAGSGSTNMDFAFIANLICGSADAGVIDAGQ